MSSGKRLRGMAWDHPRAVNPLEAISARWSAETGSQIVWDARPLKDFEDQPLEELARRYDLILIDYPFVGFAATSGLIIAAEEWADADYLSDQSMSSVGPSYAAYTFARRQWALAVDAACQVSGVRSDLFGHSAPPRTWAEVMTLACEQAGTDCRVALPLNPNHAYCAFLSVGISMAGTEFFRPGRSLDRDDAVDALEYLREIAGMLHPLSCTADPIAVSERMTTTDEIIYVPLMFGYSSYARDGFRAKRIRFGNAPEGANGQIGSVLGGVGVALSAVSEAADTAAGLARRLASRDTQTGLYAIAGGQPAHAAAWESPEVNALVDDFFTATRRTIEQAFVRPQVAGHRQFQVLAGDLIHRCVWQKDVDPPACVREYSRLVESLLADWGDDETAKDRGRS
jgi:multiple sugar transport system substrate-binding protein